MTDAKRAFFALLRSGLWEQDIALLPFGTVDFDAVYTLAEAQSVIGLVGAGMEHITDTKVEKMKARPFLTWVIAQEQRNTEMNRFVGWLMSRLSEEGVHAVLVKGQGIAQCYVRPNWRAAGDVDLLLPYSDYPDAKRVISAIASSIEPEDPVKRHIAVKLSGFDVELHGTLNADVSKRWDNLLAEIQKDVFKTGGTRVWNNENTNVLLPSVDIDVVFVFSHILQHFYKGGIGLRQVCDWCRLLWTHHASIDKELLRSRLDAMDIFNEWRGFAALAVDYLGMPADAMPFYDSGSRWSRKARQVLSIVLQKGNFGHNEDRSYYKKRSYLAIKAISLCRWIRDYFQLFIIFPRNASRSFGNILTHGVEVAAKGE